MSETADSPSSPAPKPEKAWHPSCRVCRKELAPVTFLGERRHTCEDCRKLWKPEVSAPKPEMLEKAFAALRAGDFVNDCIGEEDGSLRVAIAHQVALALEAIASEHMDVIWDLRRKLAIAGVEGSPPPFEATIPRLIREKREVAEALRASEAALAEKDAMAKVDVDERYKLRKELVQLETSVESLRKQLPDEMQHCTILFKECERGHGRLTATNWIDNGCCVCKLEAARAEATKAETALRRVEEMTRQPAAGYADIHAVALAAIRAPRPPEPIRGLDAFNIDPSSPTPPTSPRKEVVEWCGATCERSERSCLEAPYRCRGLKGHGGSHWTGNGVFWSSPEPEPNYASPTPPSEGPMEEESGPCCEDHYADRCNHGIYPKENCWNCFPSPEPTREEPR